MEKVTVSIRSQRKKKQKDVRDLRRAVVATSEEKRRKKKKAANRKGGTRKGRRRREPSKYVCGKCGEVVEVGKRKEHLLAKHGAESKPRMTQAERIIWNATKARPPRIRILQGGAPGMGKKK